MSPRPKSVDGPGIGLKSAPRNRRGQAGFSLVETMVGITVGLVAVLVITQTISLFGGGRNSLVAGSNAQENGLFAMQLVGTDIRSTGAGFYGSAMNSTQSLFNCTNVCSASGSGAGACSNNGSPTAGSAIASISGAAWTGASYTLRVPLAPIIIEAAAPGSSGISYATTSDILTVRTATRFIGSMPAAVTGPVSDMSDTSKAINVSRTFGFGANYCPDSTCAAKVSDLALVSDGMNCTMFQVSSVDPTALTLGHAATTYNDSSWPSVSSANPGGGKTYGDTAYVFNLGDSTKGVVNANEYSVSGTTGNGQSMGLQMRIIGSANPNTGASPVTPLQMADGIVALKAQYGIASSATSAAVASWVGTDSVGWTGTWDPGSLTQSNMNLIRAVRLLVVARSGNRESAVVTPACTSSGYTSGPCPNGGRIQSDLAQPPINLASLGWAAGGEWQHYRYKIYTTVVPLRNVLWVGSWSFTGQ